MITLRVNNNKVFIDCSLKYRLKLIEAFKIKHKNAYHIKQYMPRGWDGKIKYVTDNGYMSIGLLPKLITYFEENNKEYQFEDLRGDFNAAGVITQLGSWKARPYQADSVKAVVENYIGDLYFPRGIIFGATNFGKTFLSALLHASFGEKTVFLVNSKDLFEQALQEIPEFLPGKVGQISSKKIEWNDFMVCMVPTTKARIDQPKIRRKLEEYKVCLVDECDLADSKTYKKVINTGFHNCYVKIGLSGTALMHEDKNKNETIRGHFGDILHEVRNRQLMDEGYSSEVKVFIYWGNRDKHLPDDYQEQYDEGIINSKERNKKVLKRVRINAEKGRLPALVITKNHRHIKKLVKLFEKKLGDKYVIDWVHHKRKGRQDVIKRFKDGQIDILIGSLILKRGMNFPLMKYLCNAGGGKSIQMTLQIMGRATRKHKSKKYVRLEDFYDESMYIRRHSKRRIIAYKNEKLKVVEKFKEDY